MRDDAEHLYRAFVPIRGGDFETNNGVVTAIAARSVTHATIDGNDVNDENQKICALVYIESPHKISFGLPGYPAYTYSEHRELCIAFNEQNYELTNYFDYN